MRSEYTEYVLKEDFDSVREWLGLREDAGNHGNISLASENDSGESFIDIADIIESEPEGLFIQNISSSH